jgi:hypothetical protein
VSLPSIQQPLQSHKYSKTQCNINENVCIYRFCMYVTNWTTSFRPAFHGTQFCMAILLEKLLGTSYPGNSLRCLKHDISLQCTKQPTSILYPEPLEASPWPPTYSFKIHFNTVPTAVPTSSKQYPSFRVYNQIPLSLLPMCTIHAILIITALILLPQSSVVIFTFSERKWEDKILWTKWQHAFPELQQCLIHICM